MPTPAPQCYGAVIMVQDVSRLKAFYRDIVQLGNPTVDSNFWVEFGLPGNGVLALSEDSSQKETEPKQGQTTSWLLEVDEFDAKLEELQGNDVKLIRPPIELPGRKAATFADPEGNLFTIYAPSDAQPGQ